MRNHDSYRWILVLTVAACGNSHSSIDASVPDVSIASDAPDAGDCSAPNSAGKPCDDGLFCNGSDMCDGAGNCSVHLGDPCLPLITTDANCSQSCNEATRDCTAPDPLGTECSDGLFCNGSDTCNAAGACADHTGDPCPLVTTDANCSQSCNEDADNCTASDPVGTPCDDGLYCTGADSCNAAGACATHGGDPCLPLVTTDANCNGSCNEATNNCTAPDPNGTACNDGLFCTSGLGADTCTAGVCGGSNPCPGQNAGPSCDDSCDEVANSCDGPDAVGTPCNENGTGPMGTCTGTSIEPNCAGD